MSMFFLVHFPHSAFSRVLIGTSSRAQALADAALLVPLLGAMSAQDESELEQFHGVPDPDRVMYLPSHT